MHKLKKSSDQNVKSAEKAWRSQRTFRTDSFLWKYSFRVSHSCENFASDGQTDLKRSFDAGFFLATSPTAATAISFSKEKDQHQRQEFLGLELQHSEQAVGVKIVSGQQTDQPPRTTSSSDQKCSLRFVVPWRVVGQPEIVDGESFAECAEYEAFWGSVAYAEKCEYHEKRTSRQLVIAEFCHDGEEKCDV